MLSLEEYCNSCEQKINEGEKFEVRYDDSGITKVIKKFLNWFLGSTEKSTYDPYNIEKYNNDGTEAKIKDAKSDGAKADIEIKEIPNFDEFKSIVNKTQHLLNIKNIIDENSNKKEFRNLLKACKFAAVHMTLDGVCQDLPCVVFAYKFTKKTSSADIVLIEAIRSYEEAIYVKAFLTKLKAFLKKIAKREKEEPKDYSIKVIRIHTKSAWSFGKLLDYMVQDKTFKRVASKGDKDVERVYVNQL